VVLFARTSKTTVNVSDDNANTDSLVKEKAFGNLRRGPLVNIPLPAPTGNLTLNLDDNSMDMGKLDTRAATVYLSSPDAVAMCKLNGDVL
jgi:hypothetical protein